jgi:hypothetical protein
MIANRNLCVGGKKMKMIELSPEEMSKLFGGDSTGNGSNNGESEDGRIK